MADESEFLKQLPLFRGLTDPELEVMVGMMDETPQAAGTEVFQKGSLGVCLYIVYAGQIEVFLKSSDGGDVVLATLGPGASLGEMALVRDANRSTSARAREKSSLLVLKKYKLKQLVEKHPALWTKLLHNIAAILADRLETVNSELTRLAATATAPSQASSRSILSRMFGKD